MDGAEKEYRKITEQISESQEAMKVIWYQFYCVTTWIYAIYTSCNYFNVFVQASYMEFIAEAQASASRGTYASTYLLRRCINEN